MEPDRPATAEITATIDGFFDDFRNDDEVGDRSANDDSALSDEEFSNSCNSRTQTSPKLLAQEESRRLMEEHLNLSRRAKTVLQERAKGRTKPTRSGSNPEGIETRLRAAVKQWPQVLTEQATNKRHYEQYVHQLEQEREEKTKRVEEIRAEFESFCMEIARAIFKGNKTSLEQVKTLITRGHEVSKQVQEKRLVSVGLDNKAKQLKRTIAARDQLGEGLHLMDFEQLKIENQTLEEKIEERNQEVLQLRRKISGTVQVLTHVREKLRFVHGEYDRHQSYVEEKELHLNKQKRKIQDLKTTYAAAKQRLQKKEKECLRVTDPMLLEDMERLTKKKLSLEAELRELSDRYNRVTLKQKQLNESA